MSENTPSPIVGANLEDLSKKKLEDAAEDARILMAESPIIPKLVMVDIIARRLFLLVRGALSQEMEQGWDIQSPELVLQTLGMSAQEMAVAEPGTPAELQLQVLDTVVPIIDIFVQMQKEVEKDDTDKPTEEDAQVLPGSDAGTPDELGTVLRPVCGDTEQEAGERGEGSGGEGS